MTPPQAVRVFAFAVLGISMTSIAAAETTLCTPITSLPHTISSPGAYCLMTDLTTSMMAGNAITINANSVVLDLNGRKLAGSGGPGSLTNGVYAEARKFVVVKNGTIRGFYQGVVLDDPFGTTNLVEDLLVERVWKTGLSVAGNGSVIRRNLIVFTESPAAGAVGIVARGIGLTIRDNDIVFVANSPSAIGIDVISTNSVVERNRISSAATGVRTSVVSHDVLISDNRFTSAETAIHFQNTGKYRNNLTTNVTTLAIGGTDAGGNN